MADNNINISPEMINNIMNILKNNTENTETDSNSQTDSSVNTQNNVSSESNFNSSNNDVNLDIETMLKIKSIMETLNKKNDPRSNLLYSLKPYLRKERQSKLDQYANLLKITQVSNLFKNEKGDTK